MNTLAVMLAGETLHPLPSGALWWPGAGLLCVSDLHLGRSDRVARRAGTLLPPYETQDTLGRIAADLDRTGARTVVCLGDSFDDLAAAEALDTGAEMHLARMQAGRRWIWIEGNHDPGPIALGGAHLSELTVGRLVFRHIAQCGARGEISGHFHPKAVIRARGRQISRRCFLADAARLVMPAYGTYTGGLDWRTPVLRGLFAADAQAVLLGDPPRAVPVPPLADPCRNPAATRSGR